jgi:hypothetical protein
MTRHKDLLDKAGAFCLLERDKRSFTILRQFHYNQIRPYPPDKFL